MTAGRALTFVLLSCAAGACAAGAETGTVISPDVPAYDAITAPDAQLAADASVAVDAPAAPDVADVQLAPDTATRPDVSAPSDVPAPRDVPADLGPACPAPQVACGGACTALQTDPRHCGACGQVCATGERCEAGVCRVSCAAGQQPCAGADGAVACASLTSDRAHCGACGNACAATENCAAGRCVSTCGSSETACEGACVDPSTDDGHCGGCGRRCADGQSCVAGVCRPRCAAPTILCGDFCDDITISARNCGQCGAACPAGQSCVFGRCAIVCPAGQLVCNARCYDLQTDPANCGVCGRRCATGVVCLRGVCTASCGAGQTSCDGACVDTATSVDHCGGCGRACAPRTNASARCAAGACAWTCQTGSGDCDGIATNGCEASLATTTNCGACGNACRVTGSGIAVCVSGRCGVQCLTGRADCDGGYANGCEVDTRTSAANCGACGRACATGSTCVAGVCTAPATRAIEDWEGVAWPRSPWVAQTASGAGSRVTTCAHDGAAGVQDPPWIYRTDVTVGASGERLSAWVRRGGSGRAYLGFAASSAGAHSLVAGFNTSELLIQRNAAFGYATVATVPYTFATGTWYRVEVAFGAGGALTGRLYSATGAVLATVTATVSGLAPGGVALRAFGTTCVDTIERR